MKKIFLVLSLFVSVLNVSAAQPPSLQTNDPIKVSLPSLPFLQDNSPQPAQVNIVREVETLSLENKPVKKSTDKEGKHKGKNKANKPNNKIASLLKRYKTNPKYVSIYVADVNADKPLLLHNADVQRKPASTMKLLTTFAALKTLTPTYRWKTEAWIRGTLVDGVLDGDLILKGYGDPFLVHQHYWKFIHDLRNKGLTTIKGNVIIDNSYFDIPKIDPGAFDRTPHRPYNAQPSALMYNFQTTRFLFKADEKQRKVIVKAFPALDTLKIESRVNFARNFCHKSHYKPYFKKGKDSKLVITGYYSSACGQQFILRNVTEPRVLAFNAFKQFWQELGGHLEGSLVTGKVDKQKDSRLHLYQSPTLGEQIRTINKWSNNVMTRQLLLSLGAEKYGAPATLEKGRQAIIDVLKAVGVQNTDDILIDNGSGLSRTSHFSARQMGSLLKAAYRDVYMPEFMASLSIPGLDGTLFKRFKKGDIKGRAHLKTGTINGVSTISGYMLNRQGKRLIIVVQQNGGGSKVALQNDILRWVFEQ